MKRHVFSETQREDGAVYLSFWTVTVGSDETFVQTSIVGRWLESGVKLKCVAGSSAPNPPTYGSESATD